jgi:hypothetical protein
MSVVRVDDNYRALSEALLKLGCAIDAMYPDHADKIRVILPKYMHEELFGVSKGFYQVVVEGPFGQFPVDCE